MQQICETHEQGGKPIRYFLALLFLFVTCVCVDAKKPETLTLDMKDVSLQQVLQEVEAKTKWEFSYKASSLDKRHIASFKCSGEKLQQALDRLLSGTNLTYEIIPPNSVVILEKSNGRKKQPSKSPNTVSGVVVDKEGEPLIGATIIVKGGKQFSVSDTEGKFSITAKPDAVLQVSYVGFSRQLVPVKGKDDLRIEMQEDANTMDEVVVVGYGEMKKADLTGAVASVTTKSMDANRNTSVAQALQGSLPGVNVSRSSGAPGDGADILIRGVTTINDSSPLVIVDGVPDELESVNVNDIESISVLKDAASASIYGARAASGVILVTTKRAKEGKATVEYQGSVGFDMDTDHPEVVDVITYFKLRNEEAWNQNGNPEGGVFAVANQNAIEIWLEKNKENPDRYPVTDWRKAMIRKTAPFTKHSVNVAYGNKVARSKISATYEYSEGLYNHYDYSRIMVRATNYFKVNNWLQVGLDANYYNNTSHKPTINPLNRCIEMDPNRAYQNSNGTPAQGHGLINPWAQLNYGGFLNGWKDQLSAKATVIITPFKGFTITGVVAPGFNWNRAKKFVKKVEGYDWQGNAGTIYYQDSNDLTENRYLTRTLTKQLLLNYKISIRKKHDIAALLGYEDFHRRYDTQGGVTKGMLLSDYPYFYNSNKNNVTLSGALTENSYRSVFGRVNYAFDGRYLLQANLRWDRSSRFGKEYRDGYFPSFSAAWVVTGEKFMTNVNPAVLSFLKIRGSYGTLGNERIGDYPYFSTLAIGNTIFMDPDGALSSSNNALVDEYAIPDISWETTHSYDIGLDASLLNSRLTLTFDWYWKKTKNMLLATQIPTLMGVDNPYRNSGDMHTKGFDLQLNWRDRIGDFGYSVGFNLSDYKSMMGEMRGTEVYDDTNGFVTREGDEFAAWYGYICEGIFQTQEEVDSSPLLYPGLTKPGDLKFRDISGPQGTPDGIISPEYDRVILGSSQPHFNYGINLNFSWKGIELSALFQGVGKQKVRRTRAMTTHTSSYYNFPKETLGKFWSYLNDNYHFGQYEWDDIYSTPEERAQAEFPRLDTKNYKNNYMVCTDKWLFDGSYFRCKNVTLSYSFQKNILKKLRLNALRVFASASDLFCFSHFPQGWDPEMKNNGSSYIAKSFNFGVSVKF